MTPISVTAYSAFKTPATCEIFFDLQTRDQIQELISTAKTARDQ